MNFKYKLKEKPLNMKSESPLIDYLTELGIRELDSFLVRPKEYDYINPSLLTNMDKAVDLIHESFINEKPMYLQPDPDTDGIMSGAIFYAYFKELYPNAIIDYEVQNDKNHGITMEKIPTWVDTVVIVDAGSNDFEQQEELAKQGKTVVILDHHAVDNFREIDGVTVVNNQLSPEFSNKFLSGAGVVYKFIHAYSKRYHDGESHKKYMDLAAVGIVADMMDSRTLDNNYIIYHGLSNIKNPMLQQLLIKQSYSVTDINNPTKIDIAFYIAPLINAVTRVGGLDGNMELFKGFAEYNSTEIFSRTYRGDVIHETLYEKLAREAYNTRNRQNRIKENVADFLDSRIETTGIQDNAIVTLVSSNTDSTTLPKTMTGLVAMDFVRRYKKPTLILRPRVVDGVDMLFGSGRSNPAEGFSSFRNELNDSGIVTFAQGHDMAFGVGIEASKLDELNEYMNEHLKDIDFGSETIEVDYAFEHEKINAKALWEFAENHHLYGNMIPAPKFAFKFVLNKAFFKVMGQKQNTMKITQDNVDFIKFWAAEEIEMFTTDPSDFIIQEDFIVTMIGSPKINEFMGNKSLQIVIEHLHAEPYDKYSLI